jgi:hypothetical protein
MTVSFIVHEETRFAPMKKADPTRSARGPALKNGLKTITISSNAQNPFASFDPSRNDPHSGDNRLNRTRILLC